jgi:hypothetical protein
MSNDGNHFQAPYHASLGRRALGLGLEITPRG